MFSRIDLFECSENSDRWHQSQICTSFSLSRKKDEIHSKMKWCEERGEIGIRTYPWLAPPIRIFRAF